MRALPGALVRSGHSREGEATDPLPGCRSAPPLTSQIPICGGLIVACRRGSLFRGPYGAAHFVDALGAEERGDAQERAYLRIHRVCPGKQSCVSETLCAGRAGYEPCRSRDLQQPAVPHRLGSFNERMAFDARGSERAAWRPSHSVARTTPTHWRRPRPLGRSRSPSQTVVDHLLTALVEAPPSSVCRRRDRGREAVGECERRGHAQPTPRRTPRQRKSSSTCSGRIRRIRSA
jgi:hypothetical protein